MPTETHTLKTRSTHPFALVAVRRAPATVVNGEVVPGELQSVAIIGYAASEGPKVVARANRLRAQIVPIEAGRVVVEVRV